MVKQTKQIENTNRYLFVRQNYFCHEFTFYVFQRGSLFSFTMTYLVYILVYCILQREYKKDNDIWNSFGMLLSQKDKILWLHF